jgi:hypothetical protein
MPRIGLARWQQSSPIDEKISGIRDYLLERSVGDTDEAFTNPTGYGLFVGVGDSKYMLSPYHEGPDRPDGIGLSGLYSFDQLEALAIPKPEAVIEDLIYAGETGLVAGRPKVGKSRLVHQMALAVAGGHSFLGMPVPKPRRVLIVDLENRRWAVKDRLGRMSDGGRAPGLFVWCTDSLSADEVNSTAEGIAKLQGYIQRSDAEVVIIDPWRLWLGKDENNAEEVVRGLRALSSLRKFRPDLTIIIVHHVRKEKFDTPRNLLADPRLWADSVSGHHALSSHVDACYGLERQRDADTGEEWIAFGGIARNTEPRTILLEDDEDTLRFKVSQGEAVLETILTAKEREIWKTAAKLKQFGFNELVTKADVTNRKAVARMLKQAESHGLVKRSEKGYAVVKSGG